MSSSDERKKKARKSGGMDKLSSLPDSILHRILSFLYTSEAIRTCVLSKRWRNLWVSLPDLHFDSSNFESKASFRKFVRSVLSLRLDNSLCKFHFHCHSTWKTDVPLINRVTRYLVSHHVQHLHLEVQMDFPNILLSCESIGFI
ncbi:hypothetical protein P3X46_025067 [Hevea brasiliensis]|uniref:F-box domain-containing protein n=1 Tax=Hevea brasiliensis TaxID=3981 RepID=A0ABQ9L4E3_HEVBR|nr:hypothetical protein P3X46_025067 [Hevea brasiliensis]